MVLEYCEQGDLYDVATKLPEGRFEEETVRKYGWQLGQAIKSYNKVHKIVHRDIKLNNILLGNDNNIRLSDFGLSKKIDN